VVIDTSKGIRPAELIKDIRCELEGTPVAAAEFDLRLAEAGYADRPEYAHVQFSVQSIRFYPVDDAFPRITTSQDHLVYLSHPVLVSPLSNVSAGDQTG
jgi:hypothetical protein